MTVYLDDGDVTVHHGDCLDVLDEMPSGSVDAIVTDPPYGLEFMGKEWDAPWKGDTSQRALRAFQAWCETWAREAIRVLKPGGHLLAFGGTRTYHRLAVAIEDAGFEVRDCLSWLYGSGFPKSLDVSKAIDKAAGAEREAGVPGPYSQRRPREHTPSVNAYGDGVGDRGSSLITAPATPEAAAWDGWGTALKPAWEPIVLTRRPLAGTVARNVLAHGTGAINIDGCRVAGDMTGAGYGGRQESSIGYGGTDADGSYRTEPHPAGRWPANVVLDEEAAAMLDAQAGDRPAGRFPGTADTSSRADGWGFSGGRTDPPRGTGSGGASRFYYTAKASSSERGDTNTHPTVKPVSLMRWLVRLVTPLGGVVLDPFAGSGTTAVACRAEGFRCILIEREDEYLPIIADRLSQLSLFGEAS